MALGASTGTTLQRAIELLICAQRRTAVPSAPAPRAQPHREQRPPGALEKTVPRPPPPAPLPAPARPCHHVWPTSCLAWLLADKRARGRRAGLGVLQSGKRRPTGHAPILGDSEMVDGLPECELTVYHSVSGGLPWWSWVRLCALTLQGTGSVLVGN